MAQDYFSKWPFAISMLDQKAERIVKILRYHVFTMVGPQEKLPMGDSLVERMNKTLLNVLCSYVEHAGDWEEHLQLFLFAYCTTKYSSTGLSPYEVLFQYNPPSPLAPNQNVPVAMEPGGYCEQLHKNCWNSENWWRST